MFFFLHCYFSVVTREATALHMPHGRCTCLYAAQPAPAAKQTSCKASLSIFWTCQICCKYADELRSCNRSALRAASGRPATNIVILSRMLGQAMVWVTISTKSAGAHSTSAVLQPTLQGGPELHRVIFRVECCRAGGGEKTAVSKANDSRV